MKFFLFIWMGVLTMNSEVFGQNLPSINTFFNAAQYDKMDEVCREFYAEDIHFVDPIGELKGIGPMIDYYKNLYANVIEIRFDIHKETEDGNEKFATWTMHLKHKKVNDGKEIVLDGVSHVRFENGKAVYHRDYFDPGPMIYEHVPVLGGLFRWVKGIVKDNSHPQEN